MLWARDTRWSLALGAATLSAIVVLVGQTHLGAQAREADVPPLEQPSKHENVTLGLGVSDPAKDGATLDAMASYARPPSLVMWYQSWNEPLFYPKQFAAVQARNAVPVVTWVPDSREGHVLSLREITAGQHDDYLIASAHAAKDWGRPFYIRFAHEMNGNWYSWGRDVGDNTPARYIAAWRHVVKVFRDVGATNVRWVWSPNVYGHGVASFKPFYPGDEWVDWVALDGYNWGSSKGSGWRGFGEVFGFSYDRLVELTRRPIMIGETASTEKGGDKARWIREAFDSALPDRLPRVKALIWFERDKEADWRIGSSAASAQAFSDATSPAR